MGRPTTAPEREARHTRYRELAFVRRGEWCVHGDAIHPDSVCIACFDDHGEPTVAGMDAYELAPPPAVSPPAETVEQTIARITVTCSCGVLTSHEDGVCGLCRSKTQPQTTTSRVGGTEGAPVPTARVMASARHHTSEEAPLGRPCGRMAPMPGRTAAKETRADERGKPAPGSTPGFAPKQRGDSAVPRRASSSSRADSLPAPPTYTRPDGPGTSESARPRATADGSEGSTRPVPPFPKQLRRARVERLRDLVLSGLPDGDRALRTLERWLEAACVQDRDAAGKLLGEAINAIRDADASPDNAPSVDPPPTPSGGESPQADGATHTTGESVSREAERTAGSTTAGSVPLRDADSPTHKAPPESAQPVSSSPTDAVPLSGGATFLEELQVAAADPGCIAPPLTVRCSSLPLLETCAGAAFGGVYIDSDSGAARVGTAVHSVAAAIVRGGRVSILSEDRAHEVQTACDEAGTTEVEEVRRLSAAVARAWRALAHGYPSPKVETSMRADLPGVDTALTGTADLVSIGTGGRGAHVLDWKTGRLQGGHMAQLKGYAWLTLQTHPELLSVTARVVWVRFGRTSRLYAWSRSELDEWAACLGRHLGKWDGRFRHGGHCAHCTRAAACPARAALVRADVAALAGDDMAKLIEEGLRDLAPDQVLDLRARAKQVKGLATAVLSAISDLVRRHGPVRGEASTLEAHAEKRNSVDVRKAWAILRRRFDDETLSGVLKVANGKLSTAARSAADKGQKAKAAAALWRELEEAGAVYTTTIRKVREVRNDG